MELTDRGHQANGNLNAVVCVVSGGAGDFVVRRRLQAVFVEQSCDSGSCLRGPAIGVRVEETDDVGYLRVGCTPIRYDNGGIERDEATREMCAYQNAAEEKKRSILRAQKDNKFT